MGIESANGMGTAPALLALRFLTVHYLRERIFGKPSSTITALRDVSFELQTGETLGLVGPSGSGKSTIARCLVLLEQPVSGAILFQNRDVLQMREPARRAFQKEIQLVFQDSATAFNPGFTVEEVILEPLEIHERAKSKEQRRLRVRQVMEELELPKLWLNRRSGALSGGQRQRVAIARALVIRPTILVLDEPLSALDPLTQAQIVNTLLEQQASHGLSYIFITHDLRMANYLADRVIALRSGSIVEDRSVTPEFTGKLQLPGENVVSNVRTGET